MAIPTGGLNQVSAQPKPAAPAGGAKPPAFDVNAAQAENLEKIAKPSLRDVVSDELGDQREALNSALVRMRASLNDRKNRMFDPVLMQTAAGFLKPTKTGSFGESLGYAAENAGTAAEREMLHQKENQKLEMELLGKEQELRRQMGGDQFLGALLGGADTAPRPAGGAITTPTGGLRVPGTASPVDVATAQKPPSNQQVLNAALDGRIKITDKVLALAEAIDPKKAILLEKIRKLQIDEDKNILEREKMGNTVRKLVPRGLRTEREMNLGEYAKYEAALEQYFKDGDEQKLLAYYDSKGYLESEQIRGRKPVATGEAPVPIGQALSASEYKAREEALTTVEKDRAKGSEELATKLRLQAEAAFANTNTADDMIGYAKNNPKILQAMNRPGVFGAVARAAEQGIKVGDYSVSLPAKTLLEANLDENDLAALQIFAQKYADLQSRGRQLNRTPGEGAISDYETKLLGAIYALPTDSQRAVILKSEALKLQGMFDEDRFALWKEKRKQTGYTYDDFTTDKDYKALKTEYKKTLDRVREENLDLLTPKKKAPAANAPAPAPAAPPKPAAVPAPAPTAPPAPVATTPPATPPKNESYSERLKRLQKNERGG